MMGKKNDRNGALLKAAQAEIRRREGLLHLFAKLEPDVAGALADAFSKEETMAEWLLTPAYGLAYKVPLELASTPDGCRKLIILLMRMVHGIPP